MKKFILIPLLAIYASSCSVMMAANRDGVEIDSLQQARTNSQLIAMGATPISATKVEDGEIVMTYQVLKPKGSIARAVMHGFLDLSTGFLWELAGTPIEGALSQKKYYSIKATLDDKDQIKKLELQ
jgi:hypothetical protein